jgi:peptide/nickel transport system substrate-binding protein
VVGVGTDLGTALPPLARTNLDAEVSGLLFPGLNRARWSRGGLVYPEDHPMALADRWRTGPEGRTLTYRLAPGLRWSDGSPLTAADVVFTYRLLSNPDAGLPLSYATRRMDSVSARGDSAITFHFARRYPGMLFDTGVGILPEHVWGDVPPGRFVRTAGGATPGDTTAGDVSVASGPFRMAEWVRGERVVLVRNGETPVAPRLDTLVFRVLPEEATRLAELRSGGLDLTRVESFRQARQLERADGYSVLSIPRRAYDYIAWNPSGHPAFDDARVREALSLALDRDAMISALEMEGHAEPAAGPYGPLFPQLRVETEGPLHDPDRARRLLDEAGWTRPGPDRTRAREGRELAFELATPAGSDRRTAAAELIRAQLRAVGVRARIRTQEFNSLFGRMRSGDYEAALLGWQVGLGPDISPFWYDPEGPMNVVGYDSPSVRVLMDSALAAPDDAEAEPFWRRAARRIAADHPYAFLWHFDVLYAARARLRGVEVDPTGFTSTAHEWWLADGAAEPAAADADAGDADGGGTTTASGDAGSTGS